MEMIENGMILNQERYDPQMQPMKHKCPVCGFECNNLYPSYDGIYMCSYCIDKYDDI